MAPPAIVAARRRDANGAGPHYSNEVVIDGESSSDSEEDEVMVITPQSRKRNRTSAIMDEEDEDDEDDETQDSAATSNATPLGNKRMFLSPGRRDDSDARSNVESAAPRRTSASTHTNEEDEDEVEILQIGSVATPLDGSASKKNRRLTINDSDDENDDEETDRRKVQGGAGRSNSEASTLTSRDATPTRDRAAVVATPGSSASRRSSRIERKRQEKEVEQSSARKLEYLSLDNCLDPIPTKVGNATRQTSVQDTEDDDFEDETDDRDDDFVHDFWRNRKREQQRQKQPSRREVEREGLHADGDDDLDEFIVGDNEIEYMDEDENGVISVESGSDDEFESEQDDFATVRAAQQTREPSEWFSIYMEYLEESIIDADLDNKMRKRPANLEYQMYKEAIRHVRILNIISCIVCDTDF